MTIYYLLSIIINFYLCSILTLVRYCIGTCHITVPSFINVLRYVNKTVLLYLEFFLIYIIFKSIFAFLII